MINLFAGLSKHKEEDRRTETLAALLERIVSSDKGGSTNLFLSFLSQVLLANSTNETEKDSFIDMMRNSLNDISIKTQFATSNRGTPDIIVFNGRHPICVVEVKINAPECEQLEDYGAFLRETEERQNISTALVFLTRSTSPPIDFLDSECNRYHVKLRGVVTWGKVAEWFRKFRKQESGIDDSLKTLIYEFSEYLIKEDPMFTLDDVAITRTYYSQSHSSITRTIETIANQYTFGNDWGNLIHSQKSMAISSTRNARNGQGWINFGLCFKPVDETDDSLFGFYRYENIGAEFEPKIFEVKDGIYAFLRIFGGYQTYAEFQKIPGYTDNQWYDLEFEEINNLSVNSVGWYYNRSSHHSSHPGYAKIELIYNLCDIDGNFNDELQAWVHKQLDDAVDLFNTFRN